jgi:glutamyl-tRNA reductase
LIQQLQAQAENWQAVEIARAQKRLAKGEPVEAVLEALSRGLTQKMLHGALAELHTGDEAARQATAAMVSRLFLRGQATPGNRP